MISLVTGATGLIGSHIAEQLVSRGSEVRALVRSSSDTSHLRKLGVEMVEGDLLDPESLFRALRHVDVVQHCAALVGDWGRWADFRDVDVRGTEHLVEQAARAGVTRIVHLSSAAVYGLRRMRGRLVNHGLGPAPRLWRWDHYGRAKRAAERPVLRAADEGRIEAMVLRPTVVYGPRDRATLPRLARLLEVEALPVFGSGTNRLHLVYAGDVADAAIRAADRREGKPAACYPIDGGKEITQRDFLVAIADMIGAPRPGRASFYTSYGRAFFQELRGHLARRADPPNWTRYLVGLLGGGESEFDTSRAREDLGWEPRVPIREGLERTAQWLTNAR